jgi:hypothetical protein
MALGTYSDLQTAVATWLDRSDLTAYVTDFIALAEQAIYQVLRVPDMETALNSTIASGVIAVPTGLLELKSAYVDGSPTQPLQRVSTDMIYNRYPTRSSAGMPAFIAREGANFIFGPHPDSNYTIKGIYYARPAALSVTNTSNFLTTTYPSLLLYGSLVEARGFLHDDPRIGVWDALFKQALADANRSGRSEIMKGSTLTVSTGFAP